MSTKFAVLGLLLERRGYGYQLVQRLVERLGPAWQLSPSSVYAALDLLEADGLARAEMPKAPSAQEAPVPRGTRRVVYEATEAGREAFARWQGRPAARQEPIRAELHLKVALAQREHVAELLETMEHEERLARALCEECIETVEASTEGAASWAGSAAALVRAGAVARLRGELQWIAAARAALQALAVGAEAPTAALIRDLL